MGLTPSRAQQPVHSVGRCVPRLARVHHGHRAAGASQGQRCAQAGRAAPTTTTSRTAPVALPCHVLSTSAAAFSAPLLDSGQRRLNCKPSC